MRCPEHGALTLARLLPVAALLVLPACPSEPDPDPPEPVPLLRAEDWTRVSDPGADRFADMRPADAVCDDAGWYVDPFRQSLEVETEVCDYLTLRQDTLEALAPGDVVTVRGFHDQLTSADPAQGYLGLAIDGELVWELSVDIPGDAAEIDESFTIEGEFGAGSEVQFHVHNHGPNTWELVAVTVTPAA